MFQWTWEHWQRRVTGLLEAWNRENPTNQAEPEWVEEMSRSFFQVGQAMSHPSADRSGVRAGTERTMEMARRIPHALVQQITQSSTLTGKGSSDGSSDTLF
jgi:hypothetical protein